MNEWIGRRKVALGVSVVECMKVETYEVLKYSPSWKCVASHCLDAFLGKQIRLVFRFFV
jgi:hypothetical protein